MTTYTYGQLETLWINAGGSPALAPVMAAIALAESSGNPNAVNRKDNGGKQTSWGLWQVSDGTHNEPVSGILDPNVNAQQAVKKYKSQGLKAWGTYTSGVYRQYLQSSSKPSPVAGTTPTVQNAGDWWNPLSWGNSVENGIEAGLTSAFKAIIGPVLEWIWWLSETAVGMTAMGFGVFLIIQNTDAAKNAEKSIASIAVPEARVAQGATKAATKQPKSRITDEERIERKRQTAERDDVTRRLNAARAQRNRNERRRQTAEKNDALKRMKQGREDAT